MKTTCFMSMPLVFHLQNLLKLQGGGGILIFGFEWTLLIVIIQTYWFFFHLLTIKRILYIYVNTLVLKSWHWITNVFNGQMCTEYIYSGLLKKMLVTFIFTFNLSLLQVASNLKAIKFNCELIDKGYFHLQITQSGVVGYNFVQLHLFCNSILILKKMNSWF